MADNEMICELCGASEDPNKIRTCKCKNKVCLECFDTDIKRCNECVEKEFNAGPEEKKRLEKKGKKTKKKAATAEPEKEEKIEEIEEEEEIDDPEDTPEDDPENDDPEDGEDEEEEKEESSEIEPAVQEQITPDILITVSGLQGAGKSVITDIIAKRLIGRPLGYLIYRQHSDGYMNAFIRIKNPSEINKEPSSFDGRPRKIAIKEEYSEDSVMETQEEKEISKLAKFIFEEYPNEPGRGGDDESAVDVAIRLLTEKKAEEIASDEEAEEIAEEVTEDSFPSANEEEEESEES